MDDLIINPNLGPVSKLVYQNGWTQLLDFFHFLADLPYRRISDPQRPTLVITENCATCSSKHALAHLLSQEQGWHHIQLELVLFKMGSHNTPVLSSVFKSTTINWVPEAHCRLLVDNEPLDLTFGFNRFYIHSDDIIERELCSAEMISRHKTTWHQRKIKEWMATQKVQTEFEQIWKLREACIQQLSKK